MEIYTGGHTYNTNQLNNRQVFGNHKFTKQTKYINSPRWSPSQQHILAHLLQSIIYNTCNQQVTAQAKISQIEELTEFLQHKIYKPKRKTWLTTIQYRLMK